MSLREADVAVQEESLAGREQVLAVSADEIYSVDGDVVACIRAKPLAEGAVDKAQRQQKEHPSLRRVATKPHSPVKRCGTLTGSASWRQPSPPGRRRRRGTTGQRPAVRPSAGPHVDGDAGGPVPPCQRRTRGGQLREAMCYGQVLAAVQQHRGTTS